MITNYGQATPAVLNSTLAPTVDGAAPKPVEVIASLLPKEPKWKLFEKQVSNFEYQSDGAVDLGQQRTTVSRS